MEEKLDFVEAMKAGLSLKPLDAAELSPLNLAYIGDDAYDLVIRTYLMSQGNRPVNKINRQANALVKAKAQSEMVAILEGYFTEEELRVYKRGRNAKSATTAKNASVGEYRRATGFEAVMGYLYLSGRYSRMIELIRTGLEGIGEKL